MPIKVNNKAVPAYISDLFIGEFFSFVGTCKPNSVFIYLGINEENEHVTKDIAKDHNIYFPNRTDYNHKIYKLELDLINSQLNFNLK